MNLGGPKHIWTVGITDNEVNFQIQPLLYTLPSFSMHFRTSLWLSHYIKQFKVKTSNPFPLCLESFSVAKLPCFGERMQTLAWDCVSMGPF